LRKLLILWMLVLLLPIASAFGPNLHYTITREGVKDDTSYDTPLKQLCSQYWDACRAGMEAPDVAVIYYYTSYKSYKATHDWNWQEKLMELANTPEEEAFAIGVGIHLVEDSVSHNFFVPSKIRKYKLNDFIIHPVVELRIDPKFYDPIASHSLDKIEDFLPLMKEASGGKDWTEEAKLLRAAIAGESFYDTAYTIPEEQSLYFKFYAWLNKVLAPHINIDDDVEDIKQQALDELENYLKGSRTVLDPAGTKTLRDADRSADFWKYFVTTILMVVAYIITKKNRLW
jgi:hypothetical protein